MPAHPSGNPQPKEESKIDRPSDDWMNAVRWFLKRCSELDPRTFRHCLGRLDTELTKRGSTVYYLWLELPDPRLVPLERVGVVDQPPSVEIAALTAILDALNCNLFDPAGDRADIGGDEDIARLKSAVVTEIREAQQAAVKAVKARLEQLNADGKTKTVSQVQTDASQIDGPWDGWMNALLDVLQSYARVSNRWFFWRARHICEGFRKVGLESYANWFWPNQAYVPAADPADRPIHVFRHINPPINRPPREEIAALNAAKTCLEYFWDDPANNAQDPLSPDQKKELRDVEETAMREVNERIRQLESTKQTDQRIVFDDLTHTVTLDGIHESVTDPKAYQVYKTIVELGSPGPVKKSNISTRVPGTRGRKTIPSLLQKLPKRLRDTVLRNTTGYSLKLPPRNPRKARTRP